MKLVLALHLVANASLLALVYIWLGIRDARAWQIMETVVLGLAILAGALWLHAGTWHWFRTKDWRVPRNTFLRFAAGLATFLLVFWLISILPVDRAALWTASLLTFKIRKPVNPDIVGRVFGFTLWLVRWFVVPLLLFRKWRDRRFWLLLAAVLLLGVYVPQRLVHWTPDFKTTIAEVASLTARWGLAYLLAIAGWLALLRYRKVSA